MTSQRTTKALSATAAKKVAAVDGYKFGWSEKGELLHIRAQVFCFTLQQLNRTKFQVKEEKDWEREELSVIVKSFVII